MELCTGVLNLGRQLGRDLGVKTVFGDRLIETYEEASKEPRCNGKDSRSIYRWIADKKRRKRRWEVKNEFKNDLSRQDHS